MKSINDTYTLANGLAIPCLGFGTYNPAGGDNVEIIRTAMECGYRYFDTASIYETERALGAAMKESGIARSDFFIVSKAWIDEMGYEETKQAFERTLNRLQTDYLDMYLIHWPRSAEDDVDWKEKGLETWRAMEELYEAGRIKGLGLSNFLPHHMDNILQNCKIRPVADQLEIHPGYTQEAAVSFCKENEVAVQAWSPLGRAKLLENPLLLKLATKYGKSPAQISLRYLVQKGMIPLVKATKAERMKENADIFDFEIEQDDMWMLDCMPQTAWSGEHPDFAISKVKSNFDQ